jgi:hypothetical protein
MQSLQLHLTGAARSWLSELEKETIGSWEDLTKQFTSNFRSTYKRPASIEEVKACVQQRDETLRAYIQRWSLIKNSAVEVSDERAIDAFVIGLRRRDLVEEMGRIKPKTVSDLITAMIQPVPKSNKEDKSITRQINLAVTSPPATTEYLHWSEQPIEFNR